MHPKCWLWRLRLSLILLPLSSVVLGADYFIPSNRSSFNGSAVAPGDTVTLAAGTRGPLTISNLSGTETRPIVIRNDINGRGPTVVSRASGSGFVFNCRSCIHVLIDGSVKWLGAAEGETYGIKVTMSGGTPSAFVAISGLSRHLTMQNVEVDGRWPAKATRGIGLYINDHNVNRTDYPNLWREGFVIRNNYIHDVYGEGMYIGPNWNVGGGVDDLPLRNISVRNNIVADTGWDGIQAKSMIEGDNHIQNNIVLRPGARVDTSPGAHFGISIYEGMGEIHHNWIEQAGESGIQHYIQRLPSSFGTMPSRIYNNVVIDSGVTGPIEGHGISVGRQGTEDAVPAPTIYNNTVIGAEGDGINVGGKVTANGEVRDNIIAEADGRAIQASPSTVVINNRVGTVASMNFVDAFGLNYRLTESSPAKDAGSESGYPADDFDGTSRPQGPRSDQGAFEHNGYLE